MGEDLIQSLAATPSAQRAADLHAVPFHRSASPSLLPGHPSNTLSSFSTKTPPLLRPSDASLSCGGVSAWRLCPHISKHASRSRSGLTFDLSLPPLNSHLCSEGHGRSRRALRLSSATVWTQTGAPTRGANPEIQLQQILKVCGQTVFLD